MQETNRYADQNNNCLTRRWERWVSVTEEELMRHIAISMIMGINKKPEVKHYWSRDPKLQQPLVPQVMPQDRFMEISRYLHFCNNEEQIAGDRIFKIRKIWEIVNRGFQEVLVPHQNLAVDESLILYKGRLYFKQYIPSKRSRFGIKTFSVVDDKTKFILNSIVYSGKNHRLEFSVKEYGYGGAIALELMEPYFYRRHTLYADNWFTGPLVAQSLLERETYLCGTLRKTRKHAPKSGKMNKGEVKVFQSKGVLVEHWRDKKIVRMISTGQDHIMIAAPRRHSEDDVIKPLSVLEYNKHARGIDQGDQMMNLYSVKRKTKKWYKKLFFHLVDMCAYNSYIIYKSFHPATSYLKYRLDLINCMLERYGRSNRECLGPRGTDNPLRLTAKHYLEFNPATKNRNHGQRLCQVCSLTNQKNKRVKRMTVYRCSQCKIPLCPVGCFERYHSVKNF
jgi:hypothetical protein